MHISEIHQLRKNDLLSTANLIEPTHVPILGNIMSWAIGYAKEDIRKLLDHPEKIPETCTKYLKEIYLDANIIYGVPTTVRATELLGNNSYFISSDAHTIQHKEHCVMNENEYPELIENPEYFIINKLAKRKFNHLCKSSEEIYVSLIKAANRY